MTNNILQGAEQALVPVFVMVVYVSELNEEYYIESHDIDEKATLKAIV